MSLSFSLVCDETRQKVWIGHEAWEYLSERIGAEHSHLLTDVTTYLWKSQELRRSNR